MAGAEGGISRHRAASDRPAAIQQGEAGGGAVRRHRDGRPRQDRRRARQGDRAGKAGRRGSMSRSTPARSRRRPASSRARRSPSSARCRDDARAGDRRADVHSAGRRESRPAFRAAGEAGARGRPVEKLSMGMSGDYELAIAFGATSVRVGSAIFGGDRLGECLDAGLAAPLVDWGSLGPRRLDTPAHVSRDHCRRIVQVLHAARHPWCSGKIPGRRQALARSAQCSTNSPLTLRHSFGAISRLCV